MTSEEAKIIKEMLPDSIKKEVEKAIDNELVKSSKTLEFVGNCDSAFADVVRIMGGLQNSSYYGILIQNMNCTKTYGELQESIRDLFFDELSITENKQELEDKFCAVMFELLRLSHIIGLDWSRSWNLTCKKQAMIKNRLPKVILETVSAKNVRKSDREDLIIREERKK